MLIATDNTTVVAYINKEGGMKSGHLHIPGRLNVIANKQVIQTEWSLLPQVFQGICQRWHEVDLFATHYNKLPQFPDPQAMVVDGMRIWTPLPPHPWYFWARW